MNKLITLLICVAVSLGSQAQGLSKVFSPSFRSAMQLINDNNSTKSKSKAASQGRFDCFIECGDAAIPQLEKAGVRVYAKFDGIVTASVPLSAIDEIAKIGQICCVDIAKPLSIVSDSAASVTRADMVHEGMGLDYPFTGEGVVLGIVDCGVDFNHPAFYDANNHLRIKAVYLPSVEGDAPVINGNTLPGSCYETEYDIAALTTDDSSLTHGTSTTSIAAGTWIGKYGGMAPDADIVVCAMPTSALSNVTVANSALYIADYARRVGKPCVISMSIGNHDGPHDGTGYIARVINGLAQQGPIFVLASGNEGGDAMYLHKVCSGSELNPQLSSVVRQTSGNYRNAVEIWGRTADTIGVQYKIVNISTKAIVYTSDVIKNDTIIRSASNSEWSNYINGTLSVACQVDNYNGKFTIFNGFDLKTTNNNYNIALTIWGKNGMEIDVWDDDGAYAFRDLGIAGFTSGTDECSISDMATGDRTISVGASVSRNSYLSSTGSTIINNSAPLGSLASFSSYGIDANGVSRPEVVAPGQTVVAAINSYDSYHSGRNIAQQVSVDRSRSYVWSAMSGTSAATPCAAGVIALWVQAYPELTVDQVKQILDETSIQNDYYFNSPNKWGAGIINAYDGVKAAIQLSQTPTSVNVAKCWMEPGNRKINVVVDGNEPVKVNVYSLSGTLVKACVLSHCGNLATIDLNDLSTGVYIVRYTTGKVAGTYKMMVR